MTRLGVDVPLPGKPCCPTCQTVNDGLTGGTTRANPSEGDVSVCAYCGEILIFTGSAERGYGLREPTADELQEIRRCTPWIDRLVEEIRKDTRSRSN